MSMPNLTQAQIVGVAKALIGAILMALDAFGGFHANGQQQDALYALVGALALSGSTLMAADAYLRGKRNDHVATIAAAQAGATPVLDATAVLAPAKPAARRKAKSGA